MDIQKMSFPELGERLDELTRRNEQLRQKKQNLVGVILDHPPEIIQEGLRRCDIELEEIADETEKIRDIICGK